MALLIDPPPHKWRSYKNAAGFVADLGVLLSKSTVIASSLREGIDLYREVASFDPHHHGVEATRQLINRLMLYTSNSHAFGTVEGISSFKWIAFTFTQAIRAVSNNTLTTSGGDSIEGHIQSITTGIQKMKYVSARDLLLLDADWRYRDEAMTRMERDDPTARFAFEAAWLAGEYEAAYDVVRSK